METKKPLFEVTPTKFWTFDDFLGISRLMFKLIGVSPYSKHSGGKTPSYNRILTTISLIVVIYATAGEIIYFFLAFGSFSNFLQMTAIFPCIMFCLNGFIKIVTVLRNRSEVTKLVIQLKIMFPKTTALQEEYQVQEYVKVLRIIFKSFATFMIIFIWTFNSFAVILSTIDYFQTGKFVRRLPYYIWHPYNWDRYGVYEVTYIYHLIAGHCATVPVIASDLMVGGLVMQICMHFDALKRRLGGTAPKDANSKKDMQQLIDCIKMQSLLYELSDKLEEMFSFSILANFIASVLIICLCGFQIACGSGILDFVIYSVFLTCSVYQIFILSYLGNNLMVSSEGIAEGAYGGEWYNATNKYRKCISLVIARSQRPKVLTALKFSVVSLQSFNTILSSSYSYFALLRTIYGE